MDITDDSGLRGWRLCMRRGSAMLIVLVSIAIGMLIYFVYISAIFAPAMNRGRVTTSRPWLEEDRILGTDKMIAMPEPPMPTITEPIKLVAAVTRNEAERGAMTLNFDVDGTVKGKWQCQYSHDERYYAYDSTFAGNIDVDVTYASEDGEIYVTGYLAPDHSATGLITITTDRKWSVTYDWKTQ